jgi:hypothetical protein
VVRARTSAVAGRLICSLRRNERAAAAGHRGGKSWKVSPPARTISANVTDPKELTLMVNTQLGSVVRHISQALVLDQTAGRSAPAIPGRSPSSVYNVRQQPRLLSWVVRSQEPSHG